MGKMITLCGVTSLYRGIYGENDHVCNVSSMSRGIYG